MPASLVRFSGRLDAFTVRSMILLLGFVGGLPLHIVFAIVAAGGGTVGAKLWLATFRTVVARILMVTLDAMR